MNIILIGMPGAGKSTVGVVLAKALGFDFIDSDLVIQNTTGMTLCDIIKKYGTEEFIKIENRIVSKIVAKNTVIATGGSVIYGNEAMDNLKSNGIAVYFTAESEELERRLNNITTRGIAMRADETIAQLLAERAPIYEKYADITVNTSGIDLEKTVSDIIGALRKKFPLYLN